MCMGTPSIPRQIQSFVPTNTAPTPIPAPAPTILPSEFGSAGTEADRRNKIRMLRMGLSSTIKTPLGPGAGQQAALTPANPTGKQTLG